MKVGDPRLRITDADHRERGEAVHKAVVEALKKGDVAERKRHLQAAEKLATERGCKGANVFASLPHVDIQNFFLVPAAHALLYGVVKRFVQTILGKFKGTSPQHLLSSKEKAVMRGRAAHISVTADFGRRYRCIVQYV